MPKTIDLAPDEVAKTYEVLWAAFKSAGHGSFAKIERALGVHRGYFKQRKRRNQLELGALYATLKELGITPQEFFSSIDFGDHDQPNHDVTAEIGSGETVSDKAPKASMSPTALAELTAWLEWMDDLRHDNPDGTLTLLRDRVRLQRIPDDLAAHFLCVAGSVHRALGSLTDANLCLDGAERQLRPGDESRRANVVERRAYVVADTGDFESATRLASRAVAGFSKSNDQEGEGKVLVGRAKFLVYQERIDEAERDLERASTLVPKSDRGYHLSIQQSLGFIWKARGNLTNALEHFQAASALAANSPRLEAHALWSESRLLCALRRPDEAEKLLEHVVALMVTMNPLDALLASAERIRILARSGNLTKVLEAGQSILRLVGLVEGNALAEAAITDIYCQCTSKSPNMNALNETIAKIRQADVIARASLGRRVQRACAYLGVSSEIIATDTRLPAPTIASIVNDGPVARIYKGRVEMWLRRHLPELRMAAQ